MYRFLIIKKKNSIDLKSKSKYMQIQVSKHNLVVLPLDIK